jgi:hypothetical protein
MLKVKITLGYIGLQMLPRPFCDLNHIRHNRYIENIGSFKLDKWKVFTLKQTKHLKVKKPWQTSPPLKTFTDVPNVVQNCASEFMCIF